MLRLCNFCPLILVFLLTGCWNGNVPLGGTVTFSDDGSPLTLGMVVCQKDGKIYRGTIGQDGTYTIIDIEKDGSKGLPRGTYQVSVIAQKTVSVPDSDSDNYEELIDTKYGNPSTSGLTVVVPDTKVYDIKVDRYKGNR